MILWILHHVFTASFVHLDPPLSPLGSDLLKPFLNSILVPRAIVLLYNMVLTTTSKPTFYRGLYLIICLVFYVLLTICVVVF